METLQSIAQSQTPPMGPVDIKLPEDNPEDSGKATVSFKGDDYMKNYITQKTYSNTKATEDDDFLKQDINEVAREIEKEETEAKEQFTMEDMYDIAGTIIDVMDTLTSTGLRWYAKDNTDSPYSLNDGKRKKLSKNLARMLVKYQTKFSLELLFILAFVAAYVGPFMKAREMRQLYNEQNRKKIVREHAVEMEKSSQSGMYEEKPTRVKSEPEKYMDAERSRSKEKDVIRPVMATPSKSFAIDLSTLEPPTEDSDKPKNVFKRPKGRPRKV